MIKEIKDVKSKKILKIVHAVHAHACAFKICMYAGTCACMRMHAHVGEPYFKVYGDLN